MPSSSTGHPGRPSSPPPGFLEDDRQRTPTNSGSFKNIDGGGEFIPESWNEAPGSVRSISSISSHGSLSSGGGGGGLLSYRGSGPLNTRTSGGEDKESGVYSSDERDGYDSIRQRADTFPRSGVRGVAGVLVPDANTPSTFPRQKQASSVVRQRSIRDGPLSASMDDRLYEGMG